MAEAHFDISIRQMEPYFMAPLCSAYLDRAEESVDQGGGLRVLLTATWCRRGDGTGWWYQDRRRQKALGIQIGR